jgi:hypothetical protein
MSVPCNSHDYQRFLKLAELLSNQTPPVEMSVYVSSDRVKGTSYTSLEIKGNLPNEDIDHIFNPQPEEPQRQNAADEASIE